MIEPWFDVKTGLSKELGKTLIHWAKNVQAYPQDKTIEEWSAELYMHGCALVRYGEQLYELDKSASGYFMMWTWDNPAHEFTFGLDEEDCAEAEAKYAMKWIYENFNMLWD